MHNIKENPLRWRGSTINGIMVYGMKTRPSPLPLPSGCRYRFRFPCRTRLECQMMSNVRMPPTGVAPYLMHWCGTSLIRATPGGHKQQTKQQVK